jgi:DNA polymerase-3 subunit delta
MYDSQLPEWVNQMVASHQLTITPKALHLLVDHIGNDLSRLQNEVEKLAVNLAGRKNITEDDIEKYIGVSKDFNVFELQDALGKRDLAKTIRIIHYFEANPKAAPIQMILPALYNYFSKVFMLYSLPNITEQSAAAALGVNPFFVKEYIATARRYDYEGIEKVLLLLHQYNLRSIGVHDAGTSDAGLLKELAVKMIS